MKSKMFFKLAGSGVLGAFLLGGRAEAVPRTWDGGADVASGTASGTAAAFSVVNADAFDTAFWDANKAWTDIFTTGTGTLADIFGSITGTGITWDGSKGVVSNQGSFAISGNTLSWTAVPEPSSALAGLLLGAGLWTRRRPRVHRS
jgi:hypothetical protein